jgi:hypothetical protein
LKNAREFLVPLLAERRRKDQEDSPFAFRPSLSDDDASFDGLSEADFIRQERSLRKW